MVDHSLLHNIFCHKLCLFCRTLVLIQACSISCLLDIHKHFIKLLKELISIDVVFPCSKCLAKGLFFLCLWHVCKTWVEDVVKKITKVEDRTKVLYALGQIMYLKACPMDHDLILWVQLQIDIMATKYPNASRFIKYLEDH